MKKRFLSVFLALALCLTLLPTAVLADEPTTTHAAHCVCGDKTCTKMTDGHIGNETTWTPIGSADALTGITTGGYYYLMTNVELSSTWTPADGTVLCLNGHVIRYTGADKGSVIKVSGGNFTLTDCRANDSTATHNFYVDTDGKWNLCTDEDCKHVTHKTVTGGIITGGTGNANQNNRYYGGGVFVSKGSTFTMNDGSIVGCTAAAVGSQYGFGGGVYIEGQGQNVATFTMNGGSIVGCTATGMRAIGGGVYSGDQFTMNGGTIQSCTANGGSGGAKGGGVYNEGTFTMTDSRITNCAAIIVQGAPVEAQGGGVYVYNRSCSFTMSNSRIANCTADGSGGGVYVDVSKKMDGSVISQGSFTMNNNSDITGCTALNGGGVYNGGSFTMNNDSSITGCDATGSGTDAKGGGGVLNQGEFTMTGNSSITGNTSKLNGGGVHHHKEGRSFTVSGTPKINENWQNGTKNTTGLYEQGTDGSANNVYLSSGKTITIGESGLSGTDTSIGVSAVVEGDSRDITGVNSANCLAYFTSDDSQYEVINGDSNVLKLQKRPTYTVTWNVNGGDTPYTPNNATTEAVAGTTITAPVNVPTRAADASCVYTFAGWYTDATSGTELTNTSAIPEGGVTYYAHWNKTPIYTVTFDPNGGTVDPASATTDIDGKLTELPTPTRSGSYRFDGWFTEKNGGTAAIVDTVFTAHTTVYAHWTYTGGSSRPSYAITVPDTEHGSVKVSPRYAQHGDTVTITVTPDDGYTLETLTVLDKNGKEIELTDKGDGKYTFKMPSGKVEVKATFAEDNSMLNFFVDVPADQYYYDAVLWAVKNGITGGVDENHFSPDQSCTRAQLVTFLWRAAGSPVVNYAMNFSDVGDDYYTEAVRWAASLDIVGGYGNGLFGTEDTITREQMALILYRFARSMGLDTTQGGVAMGEYKDHDSISEYAVTAVQWAVHGEILQGYGGNLLPKAGCTRAQIMTMLYRLLAVQ